jgi:hypothetical protein
MRMVEVTKRSKAEATVSWSCGTPNSTARMRNQMNIALAHQFDEVHNVLDDKSHRVHSTRVGLSVQPWPIGQARTPAQIAQAVEVAAPVGGVASAQIRA